MSNVDDAAFEAAWSNPQNRHTLNGAMRPFRGFMTGDERQQIMRIALWKTLHSHDPTSRRKFHVSLRIRTIWLCQQHVRETLKRRRLASKICSVHPNKLHDDDDWQAAADDRIDAADQVGEYLAHLSDNERSIVERRHVDNMSFRKIGRMLDLPGPAVNRIYEEAIYKLRYAAGAI